jgi:hypothetical protein
VTIRRLNAGEPYYIAVGDELRRRHFPTASPFNWRTPLLFSALALNPALGRAAFVVLGLLVLAGTVHLLNSRQSLVVVAGALAQSGAIWVIFDPGVWVYHEVWAGCLIAFSLFAYAMKRYAGAAILGLLALFVRELAAPYAILCTVLALRAGRRRETYLWMAGLIGYGVYYGWHLWNVSAHQQPGEPSHAAHWLQFGGLSFVVSTLRTNSLVYEVPAWVLSGAFLVVAAGLMAADLPARMRWTVAVYFLCFAVAGQRFNWYWGWIPGFVVPLVFADGIRAMWELSRRAIGARARQTSARGR